MPTERLVVPSKSLSERLRDNPIALVLSAAVGGALFSAMFMTFVMRPDIPNKVGPGNVKSASVETTGAAPREAVKAEPAQQAAVAAPPAANVETPAAPTNGNNENKVAGANSGAESSGAADCQEQTWPYIARPCLANEAPQRGVRVISTDKVADPVIKSVESPPAVVINRASPPPIETSPPAAVATAPVASPAPTANAQAAKPAGTAPEAKPAETPKPVEAATTIATPVQSPSVAMNRPVQSSPAATNANAAVSAVQPALATGATVPSAMPPQPQPQPTLATASEERKSSRQRARKRMDGSQIAAHAIGAGRQRRLAGRRGKRHVHRKRSVCGRADSRGQQQPAGSAAAAHRRALDGT
jgi:hypothetical protein